ncbi:MAG: hypothetical protein HQK83_02475 [Fibrobacteria bacterium]|nr:hypothetical protein [Fibrobacteria bacterium]
MTTKATSILLFILLLGNLFPCYSDTSEDSLKVAVLPFTSNTLSEGLLGVLATDFQKALKETDAFPIMESELIAEILLEQGYKTSNQCGKLTCQIELGKQIGVSKLITVTISHTKGTRYAITARLIDVASSAVISTISEKRKGDIYETNKRMLLNIASALAGTPNRDRRDYEKQEAKSQAEKKLTEKAAIQSYAISAVTYVFYPFLFFQDDDNKARHTYYTQTAQLETWKTPEATLEFGGDITFAYRINSFLWLQSEFNYFYSSNKKDELLARFIIDVSDTTSTSNNIHSYGTAEVSDTRYQRHQYFTLGLGVRTILFSFSRFKLGLHAVPSWGRVFYSEKKQLSRETSITHFINDTLDRGEIIFQDSLQISELSGQLFGLSTGLDIQLFLRHNLSVNASLGIRGLFSPGLDGESAYSHFITSKDSEGDIEEKKETTSKEVSMVKGDTYGTGDIRVIQDEASSGKYEKTYLEFSGFRFSLGLSYYF